MNLPETSFLFRDGQQFQLRWFTPQNEVDLCGHATLASAHSLWERERVGVQDQIHFDTASGRLSARRQQDWISLDFPTESESPVPTPDGLEQVMGAEALYVGRNRMDLLMEVDCQETLRALQPDFARLAEMDYRGVIVTDKSQTKDFDFVSRFFAPRIGIPEDPVTGSAHCCLAPYWSGRLKKNELVAYQASRRGGVVRMVHRGDRVELLGKAVTIFRAEFVA